MFFFFDIQLYNEIKYNNHGDVLKVNFSLLNDNNNSYRKWIFALLYNPIHEKCTEHPVK